LASLAERLNECMALKGDRHISDAVRRTGVPYATMHALAKGTNINPSRETLEKVAKGYGVAVSWLLGRDESAAEPGTAGPSEPDGPDAALQWLRDFEQVVRNVGGRDGTLSERERDARRRDLVNGMIDARKQRGAEVPGELYALLGRLERGDF
jgi:transcriptional regulator with XRE-family HTH domain